MNSNPDPRRTPSNPVSRFLRPAAPGRRRTYLPVATELWNEWGRLAIDPENVRRANAWGLPGDPVNDLDDVLERAGFEKEREDSVCDAYLSKMATIAKSDPLATRTIVQRILPGLVSIALRRGRILRDGAPGAFDELLASAWIVIVDYPIDRRPIRVAANLLRDIEYQAFVRQQRRRLSTHELAVGELALGRIADDTARLQDPTVDNGRCDLLLSELERLGARPIDLDALRDLVSGRLSEESAQLYGLSARAMRDRRQTATRRARELLGGEW